MPALDERDAVQALEEQRCECLNRRNFSYYVADTWEFADKVFEAAQTLTGGALAERINELVNEQLRPLAEQTQVNAARYDDLEG